MGSGLLRLGVLLALSSVLAATALASERSRTSMMWAETFFRPQEGELSWVGIANEDTSYVGTRYSILRRASDGNMLPMVRVDDGEIRAWHLCHSRQSLFYEVLSKDKTITTIFEHPVSSSINSRQEATVKEFQDLHPASSLACIDGFLLRAAPSSFLAIDLDSRGISYPFQEKNLAEAPSLTSLTVAYEEDIVGNAKIFAICPENKTIVRLALQRDASSHGLTLTNLPVAVPAKAASPEQVIWSHDQLFFTDGCALRSYDFGHNIVTVLGSDECTTPNAENVSGIPWAARLSRPKALAAAAQGARDLAVWLVTEAQVLKVHSRPDACARHSSNEGDCRDQVGCAWAEGDGSLGQTRCFACEEMMRWTKNSGMEDHCSFMTTMPQGTWCDLRQCGCPLETSFAAAWSSGIVVKVGGVSAILLVIFGLAAWLVHRSKKREAYLTLNAEQTSRTESTYDYERMQHNGD